MKGKVVRVRIIREVCTRVEFVREYEQGNMVCRKYPIITKRRGDRIDVLLATTHKDTPIVLTYADALVVIHLFNENFKLDV